MSTASVSVLMPCRNAGPFASSWVCSCPGTAWITCDRWWLNWGSSDGRLWCSRLRIIVEVIKAHQMPSWAIGAARGTLIGWLMPMIHILPVRLHMLFHHWTQPKWLMVYGEGEEFSDETGLIRRYPTLPPSVGLDGFPSRCLCQPSVVSVVQWALQSFDRRWCRFWFWLLA